jgi:hypothetical protein
MVSPIAMNSSCRLPRVLSVFVTSCPTPTSASASGAMLSSLLLMAWGVFSLSLSAMLALLFRDEVVLKDERRHPPPRGDSQDPRDAGVAALVSFSVFPC